MSIEECMIMETKSLVNYIKESDEKIPVRMESILDQKYVGLDKSKTELAKPSSWTAFFRNIYGKG